MTIEELKREMERIIRKYVFEDDISFRLIANISNNNAKGILAEIDMHKIREFEKEDIEIIKDIYFYFG